MSLPPRAEIFPPQPTFTEKDLPSLAGKVIIITGAASGLGFELAKILYLAGGTVYIAARSVTRCKGAIEKITAQTSGRKSGGELKILAVDLADLESVKNAANEFLQQETRLDVLVNNAGVMLPPAGSKSKQGHELQMATNSLAPYLLTTLLEPILIRTAASSPPFSVRAVFVVALMNHRVPAGGISFDSNGSPKIMPEGWDNYMQSKVGGTWLADGFAKRLGSKNILSVSVHPGLMRTELQRNMGVGPRLFMKLFFKGPIYGAYSELFAAFSPQLKGENNGGYVVAWGKVSELPEVISSGLKSKSEGGSGAAEMFLEYCEREANKFQ